MAKVGLLSLAILLTSLSADNGNKLATRVSYFAKSHPETSLGFYVYNVDQNKQVFGFEENRNLIPASSLKVLTTATALEVLGPDYQFETTVGYRGTISGGELKGSLVIKAASDPSLGSRYFHSRDAQKNFFAPVVEALQELGVKKITQGIKVDMSSYATDELPPTWIWEDLGNYYGAEISPLSVFDNTVYITFKSPNEHGGQTKIISTWPSIKELSFQNEVKASNVNADRAYVFGAPGQYERTIKGTIPKGRSAFTIKGSIPNPTKACCHILAEILKQKGITILGSENQKVSSSKVVITKKLHTFQSPPLSEIIKETNIESLNLFAELLLVQIGRSSEGKGSRKSGINFIKAYWKDRGLNLERSQQYDGSGLSRYNSISAKNLGLLMSKMSKSKHFDVFKQSLPVSGKSGSIKNMFSGTFAHNNLRAKSGYLSQVRSYTGYVKNREGQLLCFSIMANHYACSASEMKKELELLMSAMVE